MKRGLINVGIRDVHPANIDKVRIFAYSVRVEKILKLLMTGTVAAILLMLSACGGTKTTSTSLVPGPHSSPLISGNVSVQAQTNLDYAFDVTSAMQDVTITGSFDTFGGAPNSIRVLIMDDATYKKFIKGDVAAPISDSGPLSNGELNTVIPGPGKYHLTFANSYPAYIAAAQQVKVDIELNWTY